MKRLSHGLVVPVLRVRFPLAAPSKNLPYGRFFGFDVQCLYMKKGIDYTGVCVVFYCHDGEGNVLMHRRSNQCRDEHGCWDIGGGGLKHRNQVLDDVRREIEEEYCTEALEIEHLGYRDVHREHDGEQTHWIALDFKVLIDRDKVANGEPHKLAEIGWFTVDSIPDPMHSQLGTFFENYKDKL